MAAGQGELGFDRLYQTARALGEETRFKIYRHLCLTADPLSVHALAQAFSLHPNAVRQHLARLEQAGLAVSRTDRQAGAAGRPRRVYEPSPQPLEFAHPPRSSRTLVALLADAVEALPSDRRRLVAFGRGWGKAWAARRKRGNGSAPRSRRGRAELLVRELTQWGWQPRAEAEDGAVHVRTARCLFHDRAAGRGGRCCALEEGLLTGLVETLVNGHARVLRSQGCRLDVVL
ncbi:MAG TPA: helix-turn-helix domain-containing protein [Actinomycetota bacterium]|nr:helix-turn-helix domain-containing protein [Actinomycetota bacterium]